jgi:serine protease Do
MHASSLRFNHSDLAFRVAFVFNCLAASLFLLTAFMTADAATRPSGPTQSQIDALSQASAAVVGLQVTAAEGARSALTLGQERTGSGVVIGADGLVLTVDYWIQAAQQIEIVTQ